MECGAIVSDERDSCVYLVEADPNAVSAGIRRLRRLVWISAGVLMGGMCVGAVVRSFEGHRLELSFLVPYPLATLLLAGAIVRFVIPHCLRQADVMIGADFILAPAMGAPRGAAVVRYQDIVHVRLDISKGHIEGATTRARGMWVVAASGLREPAVVVRAILDRAPDHVKWRRTWHPFARLSREEVRRMVEEAQVPDMSGLLPSTLRYARADEMFSRGRAQRGAWRCVRGEEVLRSVNAVSRQPSSPAGRYVSLMLVQMFLDGPTTRVLKRSEPLPALSVGWETAAPPPLEEVLAELNAKCGLAPRSATHPMEGTTSIVIQGTPCCVSCRFDDNSDVCCEIGQPVRGVP